MRRKPTLKIVINPGMGENGFPAEQDGAGQQDFTPELQQEIMQRVITGDSEAFDELVRFYMADLYRFSYAILKDQTKAEDIVQETFLRVWTKAAQWNPSGRLKSWLMRIAHNLCIDDLRARKGKDAVDVDDVFIADDAPGQLELYMRDQTSDLVQRALFLLPERQRSALMLVYFHGHSTAEAAYIMDIKLDALESLLARGRRKMKDLLSGFKNVLLEG